MCSAKEPPRRVLLLVMLGLCVCCSLSAGEKLSHDPVIWYEDDTRPIPEPDEREPHLVWDYFEDSVLRPMHRHSEPGNLVRRLGAAFGGDRYRPAGNINTLDEVPNSTWFTNRIGLFPMSAQEAARGPGSGSGPSTDGPWTVVSAKTEGVTPGFNVRDAAGNTYLIKFDPPEHLGMASGADVISNRIFFAAGYNVPDDAIVTFRREHLVLKEDVKIKLAGGDKRPMTEADLDAILAQVKSLPDGRYRAISSKFVNGKPIGPFNYEGRRKDDPNDRIKHEHRRELRGLRIFAAWLNHFDTKQHNSLDAFHSDGDSGHVVHYLIDFASTLGTGAHGPTPRYGHEYTFDPVLFFGRTLALGIYEDPWRRIERPYGLSEIGYFVSEGFEPLDFEPLLPNTAFAHCTDRDGYWAAKIISAFSNEHLREICEQAQYQNPKATDYMTRVLGERRDIIAREFFDRVAPLEYFKVDGDSVMWRDLGVERGIYTAEQTRYRARPAVVDQNRKIVERGIWQFTPEPAAALSSLSKAGIGVEGASNFLAVECQVHRGESWSESVTAFISLRHGKIVAMDRRYAR